MWVPSADCTTLSCQAHERYAYANSSSFSVRLLPSLDVTDSASPVNNGQLLALSIVPASV